MPRGSRSGYAHHPYPRGGSRPPAEPPSARGEITMSSPRRLTRILDAAARAGRVPRRLPVHYTEFGFQTNPPDRLFGVRRRLQAAYLNQADWMAYRDPRVRAVAQYKLVDEAALSSFQSGLRYLDGRREAVLRRLPAADLGVRPAGLYGQVRPARNAAPARSCAMQRRRGRVAGGPCRPVTVRSRRGHFVTRVPRRRGPWRLAWRGLTSRP